MSTGVLDRYRVRRSNPHATSRRRRDAGQWRPRVRAAGVLRKRSCRRQGVAHDARRCRSGTVVPGARTRRAPGSPGGITALLETLVRNSAGVSLHTPDRSKRPLPHLSEPLSGTQPLQRASSRQRGDLWSLTQCVGTTAARPCSVPPALPAPSAGFVLLARRLEPRATGLADVVADAPRLPHADSAVRRFLGKSG